MAVHVCVPLPARGVNQNQWDYALSSFPVDTLYVIGSEAMAPTTNVFTRAGATYIKNADELPAVPLVVLAPVTGRYVQGSESLTSFTHPADCVYMFGPDTWNLSGDELGARVPNHKVYIGTATVDELYSWVAFAIVMWDRVMKGG